MSIPSALSDAYAAAYEQAAKERDTWRCPCCGDEKTFPGAIHIEWGNPECETCSTPDNRVKLTLVSIDPVN